MKRSTVDTAFAVAFIFIAVVMVYPTSYMFLHGLFGPRPPLESADSELLLGEENDVVTTQRDAVLFLSLNWAWFASGAIIPIGIAYAAYRAALRIFVSAGPRALGISAFLSVWSLYGFVTLFAWLRASI